MPIHYSGGTHIIKMQQLSLRKLIVVERVRVSRGIKSQTSGERTLYNIVRKCPHRRREYSVGVL